MLRAAWLWHPESPGVKVLVVRTPWGWRFKPNSFATSTEVLVYQAFMAGLKHA